jgi:hypothetical protein
LGRCAGIRIGKVIQALIKSDKWDGKKVYRVTVQGVDDDWSSRSPELTPKLGTLQFPDRIIVLDASVVPEKYKKLLDTVKLQMEPCSRCSARGTVSDAMDEYDSGSMMLCPVCKGAKEVPCQEQILPSKKKKKNE